jgi:pyruvate-formate lyase-activating enzyme
MSLNAELDRIARTLSPSAFPRKLAVELCADCNLDCVMCHHDRMRRPKGVMPFPLFRKCADEIAATAPRTELWFSFCGEPLLEPDLLLEVLAYGRSAGLVSLNINTNGVLLTPELSGRLLDSGVDLIVIGIDGFSKEVYESIRVGGDRDALYANVAQLLALRDARGADTEIQTQFIDMPSNRHERDIFEAHWLARGATVKVRNQLSWGGQLETSLDVPAGKRIPCPWAVTMMHVFWDGRVPRCPGDTEGEEGCGNVWQSSLADLWARLGVYRAHHLARRFDRLPERCLACKDWMTGAAARIRPARAS